ncbi:Hypothetical protein, conserved [Brucella suis ATCC 23445]|uniref:Uncharacterized protein n=1 Tax=Brucella suis (strain ATCC 23445 / NCTC 10510) TaxID=470137 RepID=B0CJS3_BRUSI|nr:Hypothetical protein, conserved [Brucella suis ATCC 23445]
MTHFSEIPAETEPSEPLYLFVFSHVLTPKVAPTFGDMLRTRNFRKF